MIGEKAEVKIFDSKQKDPPAHIKCMKIPCVQCQKMYYIYIIKDGDLEINCLECGLYQMASGPWVIYN